MKTILTISGQQEFIEKNFSQVNIEHKWSYRGYGNSKILDFRNNVITKAGGCGYDRFGTVIGQLIEILFPDELYKLAKRECKGTSKTRKTSGKYYGMFFNKEKDRAYLDGACGIDCMKRVLNKIGFELEFLNETKGSVSGSEFYRIIPVSKHIRKYWSE